jgi:hypothetical protein
MHHGGGTTPAATGASTTPRPKTQADPTRVLALHATGSAPREWATAKGREDYAYRYFRQRLPELSPAQVAALVGNLAVESRGTPLHGMYGDLNPDIYPPGSSAYGIGQWSPDRQKDLFKLPGGRDPKNLLAQLIYVAQELTMKRYAGHLPHPPGTTQPYPAYTDLQKALTLTDATRIAEREYEGPAHPAQSFVNRRDVALAIFRRNIGSDIGALIASELRRFFAP